MSTGRVIYKCFACGLERATKKAAERHAKNCTEPIRKGCGCTVDIQDGRLVTTPCEAHERAKGATA